MNEQLAKELRNTILPPTDENEDVFTTKEYADAIGVHMSQAREHLRRLRELGKVETTRKLVIDSMGRKTPMVAYRVKSNASGLGTEGTRDVAVGDPQSSGRRRAK